MKLYTCPDCKASFLGTARYAHHRRYEKHKTNAFPSKKATSAESGRVVSLSQLKSHENAFRQKRRACLQCGTVNQNPKFCSRSCAARYQNAHNAPKRRGPLPKERPEVYPSSHVYYNVCAATGQLFSGPTYRKYHPSSRSLREQYYAASAFAFNVYEYPEWFDLSLLAKHGWYATPGSEKRGKRNPAGVSRDHLLSVSEGFAKAVDPKLIAHPANCCLMLHVENNRKSAKSTITVEELLDRIAKFEEMYPSWNTGGGGRN